MNRQTTTPGFSVRHLLTGLFCIAVTTLPASGATSWRQALADAYPKAVDQVLASARSQDVFLRANAIEAASALPQRVGPLVQLGLEDPNPIVRFAAAATVGRLKLRGMAPALDRVRHDPSPSVRAAAIFALRQCGHPVDMSSLAGMLTSTDVTDRGNAVMLMGLTGDRSAVPMLKDLAGFPMVKTSAVQEAIVRIQFAEAIAKLGDDSALNAIRASAYSQFDEVRIMAVTMLGQLQDRRMEKALAQMLMTPPIEIQVAAAGSLARIGRLEGMPVVLKACQSSIPTVRAQAALMLNLYPDLRASTAAVRLLNDPVEQVRLSAAAAILQSAANSVPTRANRQTR